MNGDNFVFSIEGQHATEPAGDFHIQSGCTPGDEPASITLKPNGDILVNGRKAANDQEVVTGLRDLLTRMWRTDTCFVPSVSDDMKIKRCEFGVRHGGKHSWEYPPTDKGSTDGGAAAPTEPAPPPSVDPCRSGGR